ncbi:MAG: 3-isopropylmalate dehydratase large subunit [Pseudomonadota bacterium]
MAGRTLYDKLFDEHAVRHNDDGTSLLYIDRHLLHEVTSAQAFEGVRMAGRELWRLDANLAVVDHNIPTTALSEGIKDPISKLQVDTLNANCARTGVEYFQRNDPRNGIVHVVGPEQGATLPGATLVCGDSHTSTHGALAVLAFGIGTSEVEHVMATQCLLVHKMKNMRVTVDGELGPGVTAKDMALAIIGRIGTAGGTGHTIEYAGEAVRALSMEGRMTLSNMTIEAGARTGLIAVDDTTIDYVRGRPFAPRGDLWELAEAAWRELVSDPDAAFDREIHLDAATIVPQITWGTSPEMVLPVNAQTPNPEREDDEARKAGISRALEYMDLVADMPLTDIRLDKIFIGSCTNSRIEDLRAAADVLRGRRIADSIKLAMIVPGSGLIKRQAESEGLDRVFIDAGFEWREPGCSMCLAMNDDRLNAGERCASTSNRNFEGRQGPGGRTHLVSPAMAAAAAVAGHFVDVREFGSSA